MQEAEETRERFEQQIEQKQSQEKINEVMGEEKEELRKIEEAHQLAIDKMTASHQMNIS